MVNQVISASRYNVLQGRIDNILGIGSGDTGYNQTVTSSQVPVGKTVTAEDMNNLHTDYNKTRIHQTAAVPGTINTVATEADITEALHVAYENLISSIENDKLVVGTGQAAVESFGNASTRTAIWGGAADPQSCTHEFSIIWTSENNRRGFFNAGGEIRFASSLTGIPGSGASASKSLNWQNMLNNMGTIKFNHTSTVSTGTGTGTSIGNYDLTSSYQQIFTKAGGVGSVYESNDYTISAKLTNSTTITFKVIFQDDASGGADESVSGTLSSTISQFRSTGVYVSSESPTATNLVTLA
tara:strand:- start:4402 stop:5295 length:894 start_codon:yes stop_codon:yes gene_type:complete